MDDCGGAADEEEEKYEMKQDKRQTLKLHELLYQSGLKRDIHEQPLRQVQAPGKRTVEVDSDWGNDRKKISGKQKKRLFRDQA